MHTHRRTMWAAAVIAVSIGFVSRKAMAAATVDASITVTPVATVNLSISPTTYAFGNLGIGSQNVATSSLTLTNAGQVNVSVDKRIQTNPADWTAGTTPGPDTYVLYVATSTTVPLDASLFNDSDHQYGTQGNVTALKGLGGSTPNLATSGATSIADLWFRLDTPTSVTVQTPQTITVRFTGTAL
jgi:hypothetical protein